MILTYYYTPPYSNQFFRKIEVREQILVEVIRSGTEIELESGFVAGRFNHEVMLDTAMRMLVSVISFFF